MDDFEDDDVGCGGFGEGEEAEEGLDECGDLIGGGVVGGGGHAPVLLESVVGLLRPSRGVVVVDCTAGLGGHASAMGRCMEGEGVVVLVDVDPWNLARAEEAVRETGVRVIARRCAFSGVEGLVRGLMASGEIPRGADVVLADLGFASTQVDDAGRGLSFRRDGPLDMRLDPEGETTAADLVAGLDEKELADLIYGYGEERYSRRIARRIVERRGERAILTTGELAAVVRSAVPFGGGGGGGGGKRGKGGGRKGGRGGRGGGIDPATRTFQALRIAVNDEIGELEALLGAVGRGAAEVCGGGCGWLSAGARVGVISFHSLEDRPVKRAFVSLAEAGLVRRVTKKPVVAEDVERALNPRSRSAKLRVVEVVVGGGGG